LVRKNQALKDTLVVSKGLFCLKGDKMIWEHNELMRVLGSINEHLGIIAKNTSEWTKDYFGSELGQLSGKPTDSGLTNEELEDLGLEK